MLREQHLTYRQLSHKNYLIYNFMRKTINTKGYSLVEVLVAVGILMLSIVAPMTIAVKSIQSSQYVYQQNTATFLAQEGVGIIGSIRNNNILEYFNNPSGSPDPWDWVGDVKVSECFNASGCNIDSTFSNAVSCSTSTNCLLYFDETNGQAKYHIGGTSDNESIFTRIITLVNDGDEVRVESRVEWESKLFGSDTPAVVVSTSFFNVYKP